MKNDNDLKISLIQLFIVFFKLGLTSFGGPIAHLSFFREEFVIKRKWLTEKTYVELIAMGQFLPGPASSQVGIAIGLLKRNTLGSIVSWVAFTLPSFIILLIFGLIYKSNLINLSELLNGLKIATVPIIIQALLGINKTMCNGKIKKSLALLSAITVLLIPIPFIQLVIILISGFIGYKYLHHDPIKKELIGISYDLKVGFICLILFVILFLGLPILTLYTDNYFLVLFSKMYMTGSLVFGGGHVVLPLLQAEVLSNGWLSEDSFLAGYSVAQAIPGPLFTIATYIGAASNNSLNNVIGAIVSTVGIFLPGFLLMIGVLPFWEKVNQNIIIQKILQGIYPCVVGILLAALYDPVWVNAIKNVNDFCIALGGFLLLIVLRMPTIIVLLFCFFSSLLINYIS